MKRFLIPVLLCALGGIWLPGGIAGLPRHSASKPTVGAQINWNHPLANGLVDVWLFNEGAGFPRSLVVGDTTSTNPGPAFWRYGPHGVRRTYNGSTTMDGYADSPQRELTGAMSVAIGFTSDTANPSAVIAGKRASNSAAVACEWNVAIDPTAGIFWGWTGGGAFQSIFNGASLGAVAASTDTNMAGTRPTAATSGKLYKNGLLIQSTSSLTAPASGNSFISFGAINSNIDNFAGGIYYTYIWNRELTASEIQWLNYDPYAFIVPQQGLTLGNIPATPRHRVINQ